MRELVQVMARIESGTIAATTAPVAVRVYAARLLRPSEPRADMIVARRRFERGQSHNPTTARRGMANITIKTNVVGLFLHSDAGPARESVVIDFETYC